NRRARLQHRRRSRGRARSPRDDSPSDGTRPHEVDLPLHGPRLPSHGRGRECRGQAACVRPNVHAPRRRTAMDRRDFIKTAGTLLAVSRLPAYAEQFAETHKRVGLIGAGWYGKADLLRLVQVAPVEVVSLCDVDRTMLADAAALVASRQASRKTP